MTERSCSDIPRRRAPAALAALAGAALLAGGCASVENTLSGDKVDYRSSKVRAAPLDVPPDLSQLARDARFQPTNTGAVSAATFPAGAAVPAATAAATSATVAVTPTSPAAATATGAVARLERAGNERWLVVGQTPEQLWPRLQAFWKERGFNLVIEQADVGILETDWAENRAKLPQDIIRSTIGRVFNNLYSTGERDRFRTRIERTAAGSEVFISHRGMVEVYTDQQRTATVWQPRPSDSELEAEFLVRLAGVLNGTAALAAAPRTTAATGVTPAVATAPAAPATPPRARIVENATAASLLVDDSFDRAWRRVGLALDRTGFTVEDRDRNAGTYFVRFVPPQSAATDDRGFLARLFTKPPEAPDAQRKRITVRADGDARAIVQVQDAQGAGDRSDSAQRIVTLLLDDLK
jgi:outer membrane protein assembly factor BamC